MCKVIMEHGTYVLNDYFVNETYVIFKKIAIKNRIIQFNGKFDPVSNKVYVVFSFSQTIV